MNLGLQDKSCVVLASSAGLGLAVARSLLREGARVQISGRAPDRLQAAVDPLAVRQPVANLVYSNVQRSGLTAFLKTLSNEVARDGVLVNSVCTGLFDTERLQSLFESRARASGRTAAEERELAAAALPIGRIGDPAEFGDLVAFLASERASYVNGVALPVDGGASSSLL